MKTLSFAVLVLVFVVYNRRREAHIKYPGPDDDVRENIINYDDEGGGEDDMTAFDITPLQIPIGGPIPEMGGKMPPCKVPCEFLYLLVINQLISSSLDLNSYLRKTLVQHTSQIHWDRSQTWASL